MSCAVCQTNWFWVVGMAAGLGGLCQLHLARVRQMKRRQAEKDRMSQEEHCALLQDILGLTLKIHAAVKQLPGEEPARQALERLLDQFDQVLTENTARAQGPAANTP